jgi:transcriptional regulator with XRE-family HTH domain
MDRVDPAQLLRSARQLRGLSQRELAERAGLTQSVVARVEAGRSAPGWATLNALLEAAGLDLQLCLPALPLDARQQRWLTLSTSARLYWAVGGRWHPRHDRKHPTWSALGAAAARRCCVLDPLVSVGIWLEHRPAPPTPELWTPTALDALARPLPRTEAVAVRHGPVSVDGLIPVGVTARDDVWAHPPHHPALQTDPLTSRQLHGVARALHERKRRDLQGRQGAAHRNSATQRERDFVVTRRRFAGVPDPDPRDRRDWRLDGEASFREWLGRRGFRLHEDEDL